MSLTPNVTTMRYIFQGSVQGWSRKELIPKQVGNDSPMAYKIAGVA